MKHPWKAAALAAILGTGCVLSLPTQAAAPVDFEPEQVGDAPVRVALPTDYKLDTEMVVENWVLCVSRSFAEQLAVARQTSADAALATYNDLKAAKSCGRFGELRVILQVPIYGEAGGSGAEGGDALVFEALVDLAGSWAAAYVVSGSLPNQ